MLARSVKSLLVAVFSLSMLFYSNALMAQHEGEQPKTEETKAGEEKKKGFDAKEVIFGHILDAHEFHFFSYKGSDGKEHEVTIPLPVILYSPQKGFSVFMYSDFHHGEHEVDGYKLQEGKIVAADPTVKFYDFSLTRNVVQMILALTLLTWIMISIANSYKKGQGVTSAPKGKQSLLEPVITFVRDEVAEPNLGHKADKYLPYLLTIFFFILINNIVGLIPGTANVTGNIAFTAVLGVISFIVILFSSNSHFWGHIFNPPGVPLGVKFILVPVEFISVFIKPFALIIRLFANMVAGHIIIICLISLIFIFGQLNPIAGWGASPVAVGFTIFIYFIEVLVAFLQAFIFTMLTAVFIGQAFEGEHHEEAAHH
ncbi:MAG TPA: F0F1 ATP synthase subunit A [Chitinophagaceae bacterium]|nr:F0F1 ATP synthase subunit A [Chitinophagaceae bacterium]